MENSALTSQLHATKRKTWKALAEEFYARFTSKDRVLVTIDPDPDAIGSALAVKRLLWRKVSLNLDRNGEAHKKIKQYCDGQVAPA